MFFFVVLRFCALTTGACNSICFLQYFLPRFLFIPSYSLSLSLLVGELKDLDSQEQNSFRLFDFIWANMHKNKRNLFCSEVLSPNSFIVHARTLLYMLKSFVESYHHTICTLFELISALFSIANCGNRQLHQSIDVSVIYIDRTAI